MIRGTTAQFKFEMPKNIDDFCTIEIIFGQDGNAGTTEAPLPIKKTYTRGYIKVQTWHPADKNINSTYYDGTNYYVFEHNQWVSSSFINILPTNNGIQVDAHNPRILLVTLNATETIRFSDKQKGFVQILGYCDTDGIVTGGHKNKFMIYPGTDDIINLVPTNPSLIIVDGGTIL